MKTNENKQLEVFINDLEPIFNRVLISDDVSFQREAYFAMQLLYKNDYLLNVARNNATALKNAVVNVATIGLSLNPTLAHAYLVPRKNEVCLDISYQGFIKLAQDSGNIKDIKADIVHENDDFHITGAFSEPIHKYSPFEDRGKMVGAYVVASTDHGTFLTTVMPHKEILEIRDSSESYKNEKTRKYSPWVKYESEMIKKTVIRRAYKSWPKGNKNKLLEEALKLSDHAQDIEFKNQYQIEKEEMEKDFPIPENEKVIGSPEYRIQNAKFRGKQLQDIDIEDLADYLNTIEKRHQKYEAKEWELEVKASITEYLMNIELECSKQIGASNE